MVQVALDMLLVRYVYIMCRNCAQRRPVHVCILHVASSTRGFMPSVCAACFLLHVAGVIARYVLHADVARCVFHCACVLSVVGCILHVALCALHDG